MLLALLLAAGIWRWSAARQDDCDRYLAGDKRLPASQSVISGTRQIAVPCNQWLMRQPERVQILCLVDLVLTVVFVLNALADLRRI